MKNLFFLFFALSCIVFSCKKDKNYGTSSGGNSNSTSTTITSSNANSWYAFFVVNKRITFNSSGTAQILYQSGAGFCSAPKQVYSASLGILVDSVRLNNSTMYCATGVKEYIFIDSIGVVSLAGSTHPINFPYTFQTYGNNGIPSFIYTVNNPVPTFNGYNSIPDTFHIGTALVLNLQGISGADSIAFSINDGTHTIAKTFAGNVSTINLPVSLMAQLSNVAATLFITISKIDNKIVGGKPMNFSTNVYITKNIELIN